jgi:hypothetical protein
MTITLRKRKQGKNGKVSLYLEFYNGKIILPNGKIKYDRKYEFLNLFLVDTPKSTADKTHNKNILQLAKNIKNQRELELHTTKHGFTKKSSHKDTNFYEYFNDIADKNKNKNKSAFNSWQTSIKHFVSFAGKNVVSRDITESFCRKYLQYLENKGTKNGIPLSYSTINLYISFFSLVVKQALKDKIIIDNPLLEIKLYCYLVLKII